MLKYRYYVIKDVSCQDCARQPCKIKKGSTFTLCDFFERKKREVHSVHSQQDYYDLVNSIYMIKNIIETKKHKIMRDDFLPESLRSLAYENGATYTECCAFIDVLKVYLGYLEEDRVDIGSTSKRMTPLFRTVITIDNNKMTLQSEDMILVGKIKKEMKKYVKTICFVVEKEDNTWK